MKIFSFLFATVFTLALLWALGWFWFAASIAMAKPETKMDNTDAIIVFTGGNGRVNEGLDLLDDNKAPRLFISGVNQETNKTDIFQSWQRPAEQRKEGEKPCCVTLGYAAKDTNGNAVEVSDWIKRNELKKVRLVTSSYHMPRATYLISRLVPEVQIIEHPVFSDDSRPWQGRFWELTFTEYNKMLVSWVMPEALPKPTETKA